MNSRLDFLVIGAQKCATSWLYSCLQAHPGLGLPEAKREVFYLGGPEVETRGADWYFSLLDHIAPDQLRGDVSVEYLFDPRAPGAVAGVAPDVKLIASLRDPIGRAVSAYFWYLRRGTIPLGLGLDAALDDARRAAEEGTAVGPEGAPADLVTRGMYDVQLGRYLEHVSADQLQVTLYEDISREPEAVLRHLYGWLGVEPSFVPDQIRERPKQNSYARSLLLLERLSGSNPRSLRSRLVSRVADRANQWLGRSRGPAERPALAPDVEARLAAFFAPHVARTQALLDALPPGGRPLTARLADAWPSLADALPTR